MSFELSSDYRQWLQQLKSQFQHTQQNAVRAVNTEMLKFYWQLGEQIVEQQQNYAWGDGFLKQLSHDLMMEFPEMKGFSKRNLSIAQQVVAQLGQIPWGQLKDTGWLERVGGTRGYWAIKKEFGGEL